MGLSNYVSVNWEHQLSRPEVDTVNVVEMQPLNYASVRSSLELGSTKGETLRLFGQFFEPGHFGINKESIEHMVSFETAQVVEVTSSAYFVEAIEKNESIQEVVDRVVEFRGQAEFEGIEEYAKMAFVIEDAIKHRRANQIDRSSEAASSSGTK